MPLPRESLVSLWRDQRDVGAESFVCSGVFVDQAAILTVKHVFCQDERLWVRPWASALRAYAITGREFHKDLDASIVVIEEMPRDCSSAILDYQRTENQLHSTLTLNGYFRGLYESPIPAQHLGFDSERAHHLIDVRQPPGYSGCGVAHGHNLWGIAFAHYTDPAITRGCAVSIRQLWPWMESHLSAPLLLTETNKKDRQGPNDLRQEIISLILQNTADSLDQAKNRTMDLVKDSYPNHMDIDEVTMLSFDLRVVLSLPESAQRRKETRKLVASMLTITQRAIERIARRLRGEP